MSERLAEPDRKLWPRVTAAISGLALVAAGIKYGPSIMGWLDPSRDSQIVAGVPGQVETYYSDSIFLAKPPMLIYHYWLGIEQCPQDIEAEKRGEVTQSFDPNLGSIGQSCNLDWVSVSGETYSNATIGGVVSFQGEVGQPLKK